MNNEPTLSNSQTDWQRLDAMSDGSSRFCVISLIDIGSIDLCVLCVFVVRSTPSLLINVS
ncbi:hypothetical protein MTo_02672 [Microcystis aeruginosa NIES-1211]|uniref:Uncharacterized protein n=1 Tax=Microcystis aeruginosa NIES-2519 TaxID=2303981 RepID=A0A5A5RGQ8_MICAE|nr:hypothetical protein MTo_02672 [Microcystis aeruginosa NIES-1211]GCA72292.1 hypothetical protein MiYa_03842 [Microcystis aeruginosa NIES-2519]GCA90218.1 hypothetical protein MiTa_03576 [Microcystis aeruginosa NIES-4264]